MHRQCTVHQQDNHGHSRKLYQRRHTDRENFRNGFTADFQICKPLYGALGKKEYAHQKAGDIAKHGCQRGAEYTEPENIDKQIIQQNIGGGNQPNQQSVTHFPLGADDRGKTRGKYVPAQNHGKIRLCIGHNFFGCAEKPKQRYTEKQAEHGHSGRNRIKCQHCVCRGVPRAFKIGFT